MFYCSIEIGQFQILKTQTKRHAIKLLLKVQVSPDYTPPPPRQIRVLFYVHTLFVDFIVLSTEFLPTNCLQVFFLTYGGFYQMILSHTLDRDPDKSLIKNSNVILERTKAYYCFNSKENNFNVNQLKIAA